MQNRTQRNRAYLYPKTPFHFAIIILQFALLASAFSQRTQKPNILIIMADDLGAENLACYGNTVYSTPNLDRMADEGARFENAFSTPVCTSTRAMILTSLYPNRSGFLERLDSPLDPEQTNRLPLHLKTFGQVFHDAGYATAIAGKWHLGDFQKHPDQPTSHGFDEHCLWVQYLNGERPSRYYGPHIIENGKYTAHPKEVFGPDYYSNFLIDFMERNQDGPFLAYFPMNLIHGPLIVPPKHKALAESKFPDDLGRNERKAGHMTTHMDAIVGKMLDKLKELGLDENTLVIFTGDNGTGGNLTSQLGDFHLKGGKRTMNEAGTRVPFIARWPGKIPPGTRKAFFTLMDIMPTIASMTDIPIAHEIDGMNLAHNFLVKPGKDRERFFMAFEGDVYFVRDHRFRLHEDGRLYDVSVSENKTRYNMEALKPGQFPETRQELQKHLDTFMKIRQTDTSYSIIPFGTNGDNFKNAQDKKARQATFNP
ncbi:MAG: sulfatase-like hydrolase/transferase [Opitutaceae bacterium]|nr:sulfatase-like hydrolase/transferase [Opitutaceae bacterium]